MENIDKQMVESGLDFLVVKTLADPTLENIEYFGYVVDKMEEQGYRVPEYKSLYEDWVERKGTEFLKENGG